MINKLEKANTEAIVELFNDDNSLMCAMRYYTRKGIKEHYLKVFEAIEEAYNLAPAFNAFIVFKEKQLGKKAKDFNEFEKCIALEEFKEIYNVANKMLDMRL